MKRLGILILLLLSTTLSACAAEVKEYRLKVVTTYPHSRSNYTQGLFFDAEGRLVESCGGYGTSKILRYSDIGGHAIDSVQISKKYFGEGSVILDGKLYFLSWQNKVAFIYNADSLKWEKTLSYPREGWGLTTDGKDLIASDGSSRLYFLEPDTLKLKRTLDVKFNGRAMRYLNELEWIDGRIWANVYTSDKILIINPKDGNVEGFIHCDGLLPERERTETTDVLNGIATKDDRIFLTGKNWPHIYEVKLVEVK